MCVWCGEDTVKIGTLMPISMHRLSINMVSIGFLYCQATLRCWSMIQHCLLAVSLTTTSPPHNILTPTLLFSFLKICSALGRWRGRRCRFDREGMQDARDGFPSTHDWWPTRPAVLCYSSIILTVITLSNTCPLHLLWHRLHTKTGSGTRGRRTIREDQETKWERDSNPPATMHVHR